MKTLLVVLATATLCITGAAMSDHPDQLTPHLHDDVNRDGQADIFFRGGTALAYWSLGSPMGGAVIASDRYAGDAGLGYSVVAVSDFDGDRSADVLWANGSHLKLWINNGAGSYTPASVGNYGGGWEPFAAGDINGDGRSDLFFRGATHLAYWLMDGASVIASSYAGDGGAGYRVVAIAEFTGRNNPDRSRSVDVLWTNGSQLKMWVSDARTATFEPYAVGSYGGGWEPFAAGDVNGDFIADILFRGGTHVAYWQQQYAEVFSGFRYESNMPATAVRVSTRSRSATTAPLKQATPSRTCCGPTARRSRPGSGTAASGTGIRVACPMNSSPLSSEPTAAAGSRWRCCFRRGDSPARQLLLSMHRRPGHAGASVFSGLGDVQCRQS